MRSSILASIGFAAGVAAASALLSHAGPDRWTASWNGAFATAPILFVSLYLVLLKKGPFAGVATLFFCGALCYFTSVTAPSSQPLFPRRLTLPDLGFSSPVTEALAKALLSGDRSAMDRETTGLFRSAGASHILALSGLHLGILSASVDSALKILGRSPSASAARKLITILFSVVYCVACGASPSLVRACLFTGLNSVARLSPNRSFGTSDCLFTAAAIQLAFNPLSIESAAFRMSYLAILGLALVFPVLREFGIWKPLAVALSCQICTAPYAYLEFGSLPGFFMLSNLLVLPLGEVLIILFLLCYLTTIIPGAVPGILLALTENIADALIFLLDVISSM